MPIKLKKTNKSIRKVIEKYIYSVTVQTDALNGAPNAVVGVTGPKCWSAEFFTLQNEVF